MKMMLFIATVMMLPAFLLTESAPVADNSANREDPDCMECHRALVDKKVVHEVAADACDNCHLSTGAPHPGKDTAGFTLMDRLPDLCFYCHEGPLSLPSMHRPVEEGACLDCHDVHASQEYHLLISPEQELCLGCHGGSGNGPDQTANIGKLISGSRKPHSAIEGGGCISCHMPHGSEERALLVARYPEATYVQAETAQFELCFLCHDTDLLMAAETEWATGFRNGTRNLHHLHIQGRKGRNCRLCHNLHGSTLPYLIEDKVLYGSWPMGIQYIPAENGGTCQPGCHSKESYERD